MVPILRSCGVATRRAASANAAEEFLAGKSINAANAASAGEEAVKAARPQTMNRYKVQITKTLVERALIAAK